MEENYDLHEKAAKQFVAQLKDHWCVLFMEHLMKEIFKETRTDTGAFTKEHGEKLINELIELNNKKYQ
jgi:hypothetical protein